MIPARQPPLSKTVVSSYPTPEIADAILAVVKDISVASYKVDAYGTAHPDEKNYPGYRLSLIVPDDAAKTAKWFYVSDRQNQEDYNYALSYSQNDPDFPIVQRRYVLPRSDYVAAEAGTADTKFAGTVLTTEKTQSSTGHPELDALYILVDRVFETLPGQWSESTQLDTDGETVTTTSRRDVDANIETSEAIDDGVWTRASKKDTESAYVSEEIVVSRAIPGTAGVPKVEPDVDGVAKTTTKTFVELSTVAPGETLEDGVWTKTSTEPVTELAGWKVVMSRAIPGTAIPSTSLSAGGDITSETRTLIDAAGFTATSAIVSGTWTRTFDEPYPGSTLVVWEVVQVRTTANALPFYSVEIPNVIPEKMRTALALDTTETVEKGTASQPSLSTGDFYRSQQQIDQYTYRLKVTNLSLSALPIDATDKDYTEKFGGGPTTITWTLSSSSGSISEGLLVLSSKVDSLGNGLYLKTSEVRDGSEWPDLAQGEVGEFGEVTATTRKVVAAGSVTSGVSGSVITEEKQIDATKTEKITHTAPTATLDSIVLAFPETVNLDLPPVLTAVTKVADNASGNGDYSEDISALVSGHGSWTLTPRATVQSSASILPDVTLDITTVWANDVPAVSYAFFMANGTTQASILTRLATITGQTVLAWPRFRPVAHTIVLVGKRLSISGQVTLTNHYQTNGDGTGASAAGNGKGTSTESGISVKTVRIPPTIHPAITFGGSPTLSLGLGGTAVVKFGGVAQATQPISGSVAASISPNSFSATSGATSIPTSGLYLRRLQTRAYKYGQTLRLMVEAQVIDFANVG